MKKPLKIVWAVDAFQEDSEFQQRTIASLNSFSKSFEAKIEPVFVLSPSELRIPMSYFLDATEEIKKTAEQHLIEKVSQLSAKDISPPTILVQHDSSLSSAVARLVQFASERDADAIFVSTGDRKGVTRFLLGSFAESLIFQSQLPLIVVNPSLEHSGQWKHALYPTDLSEQSEVILKRFAQFILPSSQSLTLYHKPEYLNSYSIATFERTPAYSGYLKEDVEQRKKQIEQLCKELKTKAGAVNGYLDENSAPTEECILNFVKRSGCDFLALAGQSGKFTGKILGSLSRSIVRHSPVPVWILHAKQEAK